MILLSLNLVRKIGICITSEENEESKLTSEENLFNNNNNNNNNKYISYRKHPITGNNVLYN
jgi:hypothetical protein